MGEELKRNINKYIIYQKSCQCMANYMECQSDNSDIEQKWPVITFFQQSLCLLKWHSNSNKRKNNLILWQYLLKCCSCFLPGWTTQRHKTVQSWLEKKKSSQRFSPTIWCENKENLFGLTIVILLSYNQAPCAGYLVFFVLIGTKISWFVHFN